MMRILSFIAGLVLLTLGLISIVTPFPGTILAILTGLMLLIGSSRLFRRFLRFLRKHVGVLDRLIRWLEGMSRGKMRETLLTTRPGYDAQAQEIAKNGEEQTEP